MYILHSLCSGLEILHISAGSRPVSKRTQVAAIAYKSDQFCIPFFGLSYTYHRDKIQSAPIHHNYH